MRNIGAIEGNQAVSDNDWESITRGGDEAIKRWIDAQMAGRSSAVVLNGRATAGRPWITYEISRAWNLDKGVVGIYIHNLKDKAQQQTLKGSNPFDHVTMNRDGGPMSRIVKAYDPPYVTSTSVYSHIQSNIAGWVEEAISIRNKH